MTNAPIETVRSDLASLVSGRFTPDSVGPTAYNEVIRRARAEPSRYLRTLVSTYFGGSIDGFRLAQLRISLALRAIEPADPEAVKQTAEKLIGHYDALLAIHDAASDKDSLNALLPERTRDMMRLLDKERQQIRRFLDVGEPP